MIGWRRIVVTVGEKIGKAHLTYGQGTCAEMVAMGTIGAADMLGLPVSTTQVLSSGVVAGTMAAGINRDYREYRAQSPNGLVLTLPASIVLSGSLFFGFLGTSSSHGMLSGAWKMLSAFVLEEGRVIQAPD